MIGEFFLIKRKVLALFKGIFKNSDKVLDVGCGENPYYHKSVGSKIVCLDINHSKKAHIIGDAMHLPIKKEKFDGLISVNSLYYCDDPSIAIEEFSRVLKKDGKLVLMMPFIYPIHHSPDDKYRFTRYGIMELLKDNFEVKQIKAVGGIFNLPTVILHSLMKGIPLMAPKIIRPAIKFISVIIFYPFYILAQLISLLDFLDKSGRWATYFFVIAVRK